MKVNAERMDEECRKGYLLATELADYLARKGMPFRKAHAAVKQLINSLRINFKFGEDLENVPLEEFREYSTLFEQDVFKHLSPRLNASAKNSYGGTGAKALAVQIRNFKKLLK